MLKIRLARLGRKKRPFYRIVATDSRSPRDGKFLEILGTYDPLKEPAEISFNKDKIDEWVKKGAQLSNRVQKIIDPDKYSELVKNKPKRKPKKVASKEEIRDKAPTQESIKEESKNQNISKEEIKSEEALEEKFRAEEAKAEITNEVNETDTTASEESTKTDKN